MKSFLQYMTEAQELKRANPQSIDEGYNPAVAQTRPVVAPTAKELGMKMKGAFAYHPSVMPVEEEEPLIPLVKMKRERD
jgi:hypothetical protein